MIFINSSIVTVPQVSPLLVAASTFKIVALLFLKAVNPFYCLQYNFIKRNHITVIIQIPKVMMNSMTRKLPFSVHAIPVASWQEICTQAFS